MERKELRKYYRQIRKSMCCPYNIKRDIIKKLDADIQDYLSEHPEANISTIYEHFGTPQNYGESAITALSTDYILQKLHDQRRRVILCAATAALCAAVIAGLLIWTHYFIKNKPENKYFHADSGIGIIYPEELP